MPDPDDYMYMTQVIDWVQGQGWYDNHQYRLNPPGGTALHFTRLTEIPMAGGVMLFKALGLPLAGAATLAALVLSIIYLCVFLLALRWAVQPVVPEGWASVSCFVAIFSAPLMLMFQPLHIDHTGLVLLLVVVAVGAVLRMVAEPPFLWWPILVGVALSTGLAVALEILPWLLVVIGCVGVWATWLGGGWPVRSGLLAAGSLTIFSALWLIVLRPWDKLGNLDLLEFSLPYVILCGAVMFCFVLPFLLAHRGRAVRMSLTGIGVLCIGGAYLYRFPELVHGPYGAIAPELNQLILGEVREAKPLWEVGAVSFFGLLSRLAGPLVALFAVGQLLAHQIRNRKPLAQLSMLAVLLCVAGALAVFYERRFLSALGLFSTIILSCWLPYKWLQLQQQVASRGRFAREMGLVLMVGLVPSILVPALMDSRSINKGVFLFPAYGQENFCDMAGLQAVLNDPARFGDHPRLIINSISSGPELLFRTQHSVLSAPYHTNLSGNVDTTRFFATPLAFEAEEIAQKRGAELVVMCRAVPNMYMHPATAVKGGGGIVGPTFIQLLMSGKAPAWLKMVKDPRLTNYVVYEIDRTKFNPRPKGG